MESTQTKRCSCKQALDSSDLVADSGSERAIDCRFKSCRSVALELMIAIDALGFGATNSLDLPSNCFEVDSGIFYKSRFVFRSTNSD